MFVVVVVVVVMLTLLQIPLSSWKSLG